VKAVYLQLNIGSMFHSFRRKSCWRKHIF